MGRAPIGAIAVRNMTTYLLPHVPWYECVAEGLPYLPEWERTLVSSPASIVWRLAAHPDWVLAAPHLLSGAAERLPIGARCYNTENLLAGQGSSVQVEAVHDLRRHRPDLVWAHYARVAAAEEEVVRPQVRAMRPVRPVERISAYILFVGSVNPRRMYIVEQIRASGVRVVWPGRAVFGPELASLICGAALVLNLHYYAMPLLADLCGVAEAFRIVQALSYGRPVLSELSIDSDEIAHPHLHQVEYRNLVARAIELFKAAAAEPIK